MPPAKQLSNPFSTGGGGAIFESHVQASFVALMLTRGVCPCFPDLVIEKVKLQGKHAGFETDDFIVFGRSVASSQEKKLLAQIKHRISFTKGDKVFSEVVQAAWSDFNNSKVFTEGSDALALITGPLSATDIHDFRELLEWARSQEEKELFQNIKKRPISAVADNIEVRNAKIIKIKTNKKLKFNLLYDTNRSLQKKIKLEQIRRETN